MALFSERIENKLDINSLPIVYEFPEVFPDDISNYLPKERCNSP